MIGMQWVGELINDYGFCGQQRPITSRVSGGRLPPQH